MTDINLEILKEKRSLFDFIIEHIPSVSENADDRLEYAQRVWDWLSDTDAGIVEGPEGEPEIAPVAGTLDALLNDIAAESVDAAVDTTPRLPVRLRVVAHLERAGTHGSTLDEMATSLCMVKDKRKTLSHRLQEMLKAEEIVCYPGDPALYYLPQHWTGQITRLPTQRHRRVDGSLLVPASVRA